MNLPRRLAIVITLMVVALTLAATFSLAQAAPNGGSVGTGTPASCTEAALDAALAGGGAVTFNCGANPYTLVITTSKNIAVNTTVDGGGKITLSGGDATKIFFVESGVRLTLNNLTVTHGHSAMGGCVTVYGSLYATQTTFSHCSTYSSWIFLGNGGAIFSLAGTVALTNSVIVNNQADLNGGGIYLMGGQGTLNHVSVVSNTAWVTHTGSGGGVGLAANTNFVASNSDFSYNGIGWLGQGGGLYVYSSTALLVNVTAHYNRGLNAATGGGLYAENSQFTWQGGSANGNYGLGTGGGLALKKTTASVSNAALNGNTASSNGGGLYAFQSTLSMNNVMVNHNFVESDGGGLDLYQSPTTLVSVTVNYNHGERSGGGIHNYLQTLTLDRVTVSGNEALGNQGDGGGIHNSSGTLNATNSTIDHNTTTGHGGGLYNDSNSNADLTNVTFSTNRAADDGGGVYEEPTIISSAASAVSLNSVTLTDNHAGSQGGGFFNANGTSSNNLTVALKNTVLADNAPQNCLGKVFTSAKYSLSTDSTCTLNGAGNHSSTPAGLFPLMNNGGTTQTHLPGPASALVNGVVGIDCPIVDQRGVSRSQGPGCDIGAVERRSSDPLVAPWLYLPLIQR